MISKMITFEGIDGSPITEEWWFGINKGDVAMLALGHELADRIKFIAKATETGTVDASVVLPAFKDLIAMSVGKREGNRFMRSPEITAEFMNSEACSELIFGLLTNAEEAAEFCNNLLPQNLMRLIEDVNLPEDKKPSHEELMSMNDDDFYRHVGDDPRQWSKDVMVMAMQRKNRAAA
jgi:hypothetical protein